MCEVKMTDCVLRLADKKMIVLLWKVNNVSEGREKMIRSADVCWLTVLHRVPGWKPRRCSKEWKSIIEEGSRDERFRLAGVYRLTLNSLVALLEPRKCSSER